MSHSRRSPLRVDEAWRYALVGGLVSIPLTGGLYWLSGAGNELSFNAVLLGGLLAGYLAPTAVDSTAAGIRAGVIGSLPGLWLLGDVLAAATALTGPTWFRVTGVGMAAVAFSGVVFGLGALAGGVGGVVGAWLARRVGHRARPAPET